MSVAPLSSSRRCRRGFTIAEVMIAASVMALAISTSVTTMQRAFLALDSARSITLAGQILQGELERMRLKNWTEIGTAFPATTTPAAYTQTDSTMAAALGTRFSLKYTADAGTDLKEIKLIVSWSGYDGRPQSRYYKTYYGRNGLYDYFYNSY
jgi:prepilin-type N-terminal cleavage/methylation domain-containing protein